MGPAVIFPLVLGALFVLAGVLAYTGRWRSWTATSMWLPRVVFGTVFAGIALWFICLGLALHGKWAHVVTDVAGVFGLAFVISAFWLPAFLLPQWFRDWQAAGAERTRYARVIRTRGSRRRG